MSLGFENYASELLIEFFFPKSEVLHDFRAVQFWSQTKGECYDQDYDHCKYHTFICSRDGLQILFLCKVINPNVLEYSFSHSWQEVTQNDVPSFTNSQRYSLETLWKKRIAITSRSLPLKYTHLSKKSSDCWISFRNRHNRIYFTSFGTKTRWSFENDAIARMQTLSGN